MQRLREFIGKIKKENIPNKVNGGIIKEDDFISLNQLIEDLKVHILQYLSIQDICQMSMVNHEWNQLSSSNAVWAYFCRRENILIPTVIIESYANWKETFKDYYKNRISLIMLDQDDFKEMNVTLSDIYSQSGDGRREILYSATPNENLNINSFDLLHVVGRGSCNKITQVRKTSNNTRYYMNVIPVNNKKYFFPMDLFTIPQSDTETNDSNNPFNHLSKEQLNHIRSTKRITVWINTPFTAKLAYILTSPCHSFLSESRTKLYFFFNCDHNPCSDIAIHATESKGFSIPQIREYAAQLLLHVRSCRGEAIFHDLHLYDLQINRKGFLFVPPFNRTFQKKLSNESLSELSADHIYWAPEVLCNNINFDCKTDLWSLGIVLYEMVKFGESSEDVSSIIQHLEQITEPDLRDLLIKLLEKDVTKRIGIEETMSLPFFAALPPWDDLLSKRFNPSFVPL